MKDQKQLEVNEEDGKKQYLDRLQQLMGVLSNFCRNRRKPPPQTHTHTHTPIHTHTHTEVGSDV